MSTHAKPTDEEFLAFYRGEAHNLRGHSFQAVLDWPDDTWEQVHDFIQWVFPNDKPSAYNPTAPLLTPAIIAGWPSDPLLSANLDAAFARWLRFVSVERDPSGAFCFAESPNLGVWAHPNHNWLRITRVLTCLRLLGRREDARHLLEFLEGVAARRFAISQDTLSHWRAAAKS
ncbi:opioid growth factor receptor conserved region : Opioid growth factor receptor (OGFr) conserved region OS=Nostoc punctiforme (strain ATCC 29133 / PCC 73102) GN=Npun_F4273 PE=4 SV=1: OGFr_N [Gemmataceae bacterium]|nr:opioid growth factor receptor conserved region : Opioid growth factor receptor (OGFr) conserved region OS=Nostoc punctiforme (strain ATCC 29133 / PCC 73102) GN=Npun_F4273 PE=4 SV=1: OGFr_N [Gemmataceae bacterium]VTT99319.1 opioid growth factor receptor conserved region : Opioid growth factor receptor (OGFr) conserved region OS=Nostoc punctiforme (strain ATCC 29133 / PCC 73102) GN=Npun_F4273 PE=4 SV=1: OGFr_N [Gemmataceae bacterium]